MLVGRAATLLLMFDIRAGRRSTFVAKEGVLSILLLSARIARMA
jgi:hypothetical protein